MKTTGTGGERPISLANAFSISLPLGSSSSSWTAASTPRSQKSLLIAWHMQHVLRLKITTAFCDANLITLSISTPEVELSERWRFNSDVLVQNVVILGSWTCCFVRSVIIAECNEDWSFVKEEIKSNENDGSRRRTRSREEKNFGKRRLKKRLWREPILGCGWRGERRLKRANEEKLWWNDQRKTWKCGGFELMERRLYRPEKRGALVCSSRDQCFRKRLVYHSRCFWSETYSPRSGNWIKSTCSFNRRQNFFHH